MVLLPILSSIFVGVVFMGAAIPLIQGKVPRNHLYGFRVPKTLRDDHTWYLANAYFGKYFFMAGLATTAAAILFAPLALIPNTGVEYYGASWTCVMAGCLIYSIYRSFRYLSHL